MMPTCIAAAEWHYRHSYCQYRHFVMKRIALILTEHFYASGVTGTLDLLQLANGAQGANREPLFD